jgi:hypothetical protein
MSRIVHGSCRWLVVIAVLHVAMSCRSRDQQAKEAEEVEQIAGMFESWAMGGDGTLPNVEGDARRSFEKLCAPHGFGGSNEASPLANRFSYIPGLHRVFNEATNDLLVMYSRAPVSVRGNTDSLSSSGPVWRVVLLCNGRVKGRRVSARTLRGLLEATLKHIEKAKPRYHEAILREHRRFLDAL